MRRTALLLCAVGALLVSTVVPAAGQEPPPRDTTDAVLDLKLPAPITRTGVEPPAASLSRVDSSLLVATGTRQVMVRLTSKAPAAVAGQGGDPAAQRSALAEVRAQQAAVVERAARLNARLVGQAQHATNVVVLELDADRLSDLAADPAIESIRPVIDYQLDTGLAAPFVSAAALQDLGFDGTGVRVAVLDTGIDYTHAALGGPGTTTAYESAYGTDPSDPRNRTTDGLFPTAKVVDGFDFVGESWPRRDLEPDPDPIDFNGHGTQVADAIGGQNGVAPGVALYAYKVCSSISTSCSGVGLIQAMDAVVDPNGDGDTSDHLDLVNMSLGAFYGQAFDDDLSQAVENANALGVLTVASAGNTGDKPYIVGSPSVAPSAISVTETQVPSAVLPLLTIQGGDDIPAVFQTWSAVPSGVITAPLVYGDGAGGNLDGCAPFDLAQPGRIVLVDRGTCDFTLKVLNIQNAGGIAALIGLVDTGAPFVGGNAGDGPITIPAYMVSLSDADVLRTGAVLTIDPANSLPLAGQMVPSSSRGPSMTFNAIKPEVGAPGASVTADAGTGADTLSFGSTSAAAARVAGSAALLMEAFPNRTPAEIKAVLMNTAATDILTEPPELGGVLAPITRIGGGELRLDRALASPAAAWDGESSVGALSFGFLDVFREAMQVARPVTVRNYTDSPITYRIIPEFRFPDDGANRAVQMSAPRRVRVPANGTTTFRVTLTIRGNALREWGLNSGRLGNDGDALTTLEYDGYLRFENQNRDGGDLHLAWHVLPRKADLVRARRTVGVRPVPRQGFAAGTGELRNLGIGTARIDAFSLIGRSPDLPEAAAGTQAPVIDLRYVGVSTTLAEPGLCSDQESFIMRFAVNTWERQTHANAPAAFQFDLDTNQDGVTDYAVFNEDLDMATDGRNATYVLDLATGASTIFFLTGHTTNSANTVLSLCGEQIGMNAEDLFQPITANVLAVDNYFRSAVTDMVEGLQFAPLGERFVATVDDIRPESIGRFRVTDFGRAGTNPAESGLLLFVTGDREEGISGAPEGREALVIRIRPDKRPHGGKYVK